MNIREARPADARFVAQLLHDFNVEFDEPTPNVEFLTERLGKLLADGQVTVLLGGDGPHGFALLRFRPSLWSETLDAYLEELYVVPQRRGQGIGRALLEAALDAAREAGAGHFELGTSEDDTAARRLYESVGFTNRERGGQGPVMYFYERDL